MMGQFSDQSMEIQDSTVCFQSIYAHSLPGQPVEAWQPLLDHLRQVAMLAAEFCGDFGSADWGWNAGMLHDVGKASRVFQGYLRRENQLDDEEYDEVGGRINHSSAGAALAEEIHNKRNHPLGRILAYLVAGHHAGLPDYSTCDSYRGALTFRLKEGEDHLKSIRTESQIIQAGQRSLASLPRFVKADNFHFWMRMLFSALVDADFLDTEAFMDPRKSRLREEGISLSALKKALDLHLTQMAQQCAATPVNEVRRVILEACRSAALLEPGLFSLSVPTGGGKTLSGMAFALDHALNHGKKRIIYVIPYTSIIEQTARILGDIFGSENVVEHHSNLDTERETPRTRMASENWDAPIIVTTNVQFFESLYGARAGRCRKLHNIVNSVVILDEAQLVPPNLLQPCTAAIKDLTHNYGVTLLLSTATQPALPGLEPREIIPADLDLYLRLNRTEILLPENLNDKMSWEDLADRIKEYDQVLCIVNTRRDCHDLFCLMPEGTVHLSALMCGEHRSVVIQRIKDCLQSGQPIRVISTQLVEAGVDIDFPVVYRALSGLDSIFQAAGRCNREGRLRKGLVTVFIPPKGPPIGLQRKGVDTTKELASLRDFDLDDPKIFRRYFSLFYSKVTETGEKLLKELKPSDSCTLDMSFRSVANEFHLIDEQGQRPVIVRYGRGNQLVGELAKTGPNRDLLRRLQRFIVNLPTRIADRMVNDGLLEEVWPGFLAQCSPSIYVDSTGLDVFRETLPVEDILL